MLVPTTSALSLIHLIMDNEQNSTQDLDDADLVELYEIWLKQQPAGTVPGREMFYIERTK